MKLYGRGHVSTMDNLDSLENWLVNQFSELERYGFSSPVVTKAKAGTTIDWLHDDIAVEVELDRSGFDVFLSLVRLASGKLPNGRHGLNGTPYRYYLQKVIRDRGWHVDRDAMASIGVNVTHQGQEADLDALKSRALGYRWALMSCIGQLLYEAKDIFSSQE